MGYIAKAGMVPGQTIIPQRKPAKLPETGTDEQHDYITALKPDAPIESVTLIGMNFDKRVFPREMSYLENQGKYFESGVLSRRLTEKQVAALKARAEEVPVTWQDRDGKRHEAKAIEFIVLVPAEGYNPISIAVKTGEPAIHPKDIEMAAEIAKNEQKEIDPANVKDKLYEAQRKKK